MGGTTFLVTAAAAAIGDAYRDAVADAHYSCGLAASPARSLRSPATSTSGHSRRARRRRARRPARQRRQLRPLGRRHPQYVPSPPTDEAVRLTALFGAGTAADDRHLRRQVGTRRRHPAPHRRTVLRLHGMGIDMTQRCPWCHGAVEVSSEDRPGSSEPSPPSTVLPRPTTNQQTATHLTPAGRSWRRTLPPCGRGT